MAIISDINSGAELRVSGTGNTARVTLYNTQVFGNTNPTQLITFNSTYRRYMTNFDIRLTSGGNAGDRAWLIRAGINDVLIRAVHINLATDSTATTANTEFLCLTRFESVCPIISSGTTAFEPTKKLPNSPFSESGEMRKNVAGGNMTLTSGAGIFDTPVVISGVTYTGGPIIAVNPRGGARGSGKSPTGFGVLGPTFDGQPIFTLHPGEGLALQTATAGPGSGNGAGASYTGYIEWEEVENGSN